MEGKKRKKVLLVITKSNFGGAQRYVYDLAHELHTKYADTYEVRVAFGGTGLLKSKLEQVGIETYSIEALGRDVRFLDDFTSARALSAIIRAYRPDILHLNSSKIGAIGSVLGRLHRIPTIVFTGHGWAFNQKRHFLATLLIKYIYRITLACTHSVIAVSKQTKDDVIAMGMVSSKKIHVVYNGIDSDTHALFSKHDARTKLNLPEKAFVIGTIAELHPRKGIDILLKSLEQLPFSAHTCIIGEGESRHDLETHITKAGLSDSVTLTGFVENAADYLKAFDVFVLPSRDEALPYVILEAGRAHVPVIASRIAGVPEILDNGNAGMLFTSEDALELRKMLIDIFNTTQHSSPSLQNYGERLHERVQTVFSIHEMTRKTIQYAYT